MNKITCNHCGKQIEVSEAFRHEIEESLKKSFEQRHKKEVEEAAKKAEENTKKELMEKSTLELDDLKKQLEEQKIKNEEFRKEELRLREEKRKLEEKEKEFDLKMQRTVDEERKKIRTEIEENERRKVAEKDQIIESLKKKLEDASRQASQGSQQLQGEAPELEVEKMLKNAFPTDVIEPVEKGIRGADLRHTVKTNLGNTCGVILWEVKNTKTWSDGWLTKLKDDLRAEKANIPVIISTVLPDEAGSGMGIKSGVWVVSPSLFLPLAEVLREKLRDVAREKFIATSRESDAEAIYSYITSHEFKQQVEAMIEVYQEMKEEIDRERRAFERMWSRREVQVNKLLNSTARVVGGMQGRLTSGQMSHIKGLTLPELEDGQQ